MPLRQNPAVGRKREVGRSAQGAKIREHSRVAPDSSGMHLASSHSLLRSLALGAAFACAALSVAQSGFARSAPETPPARPQIEVCFVLDTTGSMSGLIEGAKKKIWSIANALVGAQPTPQIRFALVGYRDRKDEYVVKTHPLTDDIDAVYAKLREFSAGGGGDTPEAVNQALEEAVRRISWSTDSKTLRLIFLVGDAPPHMDYPDDVKYPVLCAEAQKKGILINTVQCGADSETRRVWQEIARLGEGEYTAIAQEGGMRVTTTPFDERLAELNREIGRTLVPYGAVEKRREVTQKQALAEAAPAPAVSDRMEFNRATGKVVQGGGDLLDALKAGEVKRDAIKSESLPEEWRKLEPKERDTKLTETANQRAKIQEEIGLLSRKRADYVRDEEKKQAAAGKGDGFDAKVRETVTAQAKRRGIDLR